MLSRILIVPPQAIGNGFGGENSAFETKHSVKSAPGESAGICAFVRRCSVACELAELSFGAVDGYAQPAARK